MSVNFNKDSVFNLKEIKLDSIRKDVAGLLIEGEEAVMAFHSVRDQLVFTNYRIIAIDIQGVTGTRKAFTSLPSARIQYFTVQTPGFGELFPDTELFVMFSNRFTARFEFKSKSDIGKIARLIGNNALK